MFAHFSLPDVEVVSRRSVFTALIGGVVALVLCVVFGQAMAGIGACIGLGLGIYNFRLVQNSVAKVGASADDNKRRPLALNTMVRLGLITVVVIGLLFVNFDLGFGVLAGIGAFQAILLANVGRSMFAMGAAPTADEGPAPGHGSQAQLFPVEVPDERRDGR